MQKKKKLNSMKSPKTSNTWSGELKIANNVVCGSDVVSFYTSEAAMVKELRENLSRLKSTVPDDVTITIFEEDH
jgi:hypothetical protein